MSAHSAHDQPNTLDLEIQAVLNKMRTETPGSTEYYDLVEALTKLNAIKSQTAPDRISKDQIVGVVGHILGLGMILHFERMAPIASKAMAFVVKPRI